MYITISVVFFKTTATHACNNILHLLNLNLKVTWQEHIVCYRATGRGLHGWLKENNKSDFFNLVLKTVKVGANFTSDGSLFQSGIVLMKKEFANGLFYILCWLLNMTIWCKHVHRLELQKFNNFCAAHLPVRLDIEIKFPYFLLLTQGKLLFRSS